MESFIEENIVYCVIIFIKMIDSFLFDPCLLVYIKLETREDKYRSFWFILAII